MVPPPVRFLTEEQVRRIHEASLEILEGVGLQVRNAGARAIFAYHGCRVDSEHGTVRLPRGIVEEHRASLPPTFTFHARDASGDRRLPADSPVIVTGSSAPNLIDPVTGAERRARAEDIARIARLIDELAGYDVFSISTLADDAPPGLQTVTRLYASLRYCAKPIRVSGPPEELPGLLRLAHLVAGGEAAYRERPFVTHHYCPVISPLTMDDDSTGILMTCAERGLPGYPTIVPNAGLTAPFTLVGTLALGNAEFLAAAVLEQMIRPGKPTIYASLPTVADLRTGAYAPGAIETGLLLGGVAQLARFYGVPCGGYIGLTNAKVNDAQSGFETGMATVAGVLAGVDMLNMGGLLDALMTFDFAKAVIDHEIALMLRRVRRGLAFDDPDLALDVIAEVGPGGMFADHPHTLAHMRTTALLPEIADRNPRQTWLEAGALDCQARALERARAILTRDGRALFSPEVDARLRAEFPALVAADLTLPGGWASTPDRLPAPHGTRRRARETP